MFLTFHYERITNCNMATLKKLVSGKWQAQIARQGIRKSRSFATKREAQDWAARQEYLDVNPAPTGSTIKLGEIFDRYAREESGKKRGARWEILRLAKLAQDRISEKN